MIFAIRMSGGQIRRESGDVLVILGGIIAQCCARQFAARPGEIKRMSEEMFGRDLRVEIVDKALHDAVNPAANGDG